MATVIATSRYQRGARRLLAEDERAALRDAIASNPELYPVIPGTGGVRKARWGRQGKGKSGGVRVIYYYWTSDDEVYLLYIYSKNEQADMDAADRKSSQGICEGTKTCQRRK
ncbi:MAG: type II toxin-antitoxin system RelE/ParE family toxin [Bryobacteraceae bacterium]